MKNLLLALDLNHIDSLLLRYALQLGKAFGSKTWNLHIAFSVPDYPAGEWSIS